MAYKQLFGILVVGFFIAPQVALAAWWNPISWSVWNIFRPAPKVQQVQVATTTVAILTATTTKKTEANIKQDTPKENKDSLISSLKKQVADLTQKANQPSQPKVEAPKTSIITLPSGAIVEMDANGNVIRTIKVAPQQTYTTPAPVTQNQPTPSASSAPVSRMLEVSLQSNAPEIHSKIGEAVTRAALFPFTLKASGNADTHISKIKFRTLGPTRFTDMWIESGDATYIGNKIDASSVFIGGYGYIPISITITPGRTSNFTLYVNVPAGAAKSSGVEQLYMEGITSDAGSMSDFPLSGNASLWYDRAPDPKISSMVLGFYNPPGADVVINYLEFTSDQDIDCRSGNLAGGVAAGVTTKHCVIEGDNAAAKIRAHLSECNTTWDKGFYIFSTNQQVDPTKVYSCNITAQGINGTSVNYKHTFSVPN